MVTDAKILNATILIVDDEPAMTLLLTRILQKAGYQNITSVNHPKDALELLETFQPDLLCTDKQMPTMTGLQLIEAVRKTYSVQDLPIIMLTADSHDDSEAEALSKGANDFISKPYKPTQIHPRVKNALLNHFLTLELRQSNDHLEEKVRERTRALESAYLETLERLVLATEQRDDITGKHALRVGKLSADVAEKLGLSKSELSLLRLAAPLHDIGKVSIDNSILQKRGKLTDEEYQSMKKHVEAGVKILTKSNNKLLQLAEIIALTHHERWDGSGYPKGLKGDDIPIVGQIVAVADVFDVLMSERPYKEAWPLEAAIEEITKNSGKWYSPRVVHAFLQVMEEQHQRSFALTMF
ncbi:MAG: response regulator [Trueperaceae bacterium]